MSTTKNCFLPILLILTLVVASTLFWGSPQAKASPVLNVPSTSYPTIQSALNVAKDGDTIKIAPGTYNENVNYDGYAQAVVNGGSKPKTGVTVQGSTGTVINGAVNLLYLNEFRISDLTITGNLTLGNSGAYGYVSQSIVSGVQVGLILTVGGPGNTVVDCTAKMLILRGGNTKTEFPAVNTAIKNNQLRGLTIQAGSHSNIVNGNLISQGQTGLVEEPSKTFYITGNNQFVNNTITGNDVGVFLYSSTGDNGASSHSADILVQNVIRDNDVGVVISGSSQYPVGNTFYHNDFIGNSVQVKIEGATFNLWDNLGKGNYWSDYTGKDGNGDGIGDAPYKIDSQNQDNYPLMKPYSATAYGAATEPVPQRTASTPSSEASNPASLSIAPETTSLTAVSGMLAVSVLVLFYLKRKAAPV